MGINKDTESMSLSFGWNTPEGSKGDLQVNVKYHDTEEYGPSITLSFKDKNEEEVTLPIDLMKDVYEYLAEKRVISSPISNIQVPSTVATASRTSLPMSSGSLNIPKITSRNNSTAPVSNSDSDYPVQSLTSFSSSDDDDFKEPLLGGDAETNKLVEQLAAEEAAAASANTVQQIQRHPVTKRAQPTQQVASGRQQALKYARAKPIKSVGETKEVLDPHEQAAVLEATGLMPQTFEGIKGINKIGEDKKGSMSLDNTIDILIKNQGLG